MRSRILVSAFVVVGFAGAATIAARAAVQVKTQSSYIGQKIQWSIANFRDTVRVNGAFVSGPVLIVHDDEKMARGEPCTTFYRFDPSSGPKEALVSFHCKPHRTSAPAATTFKTVNTGEGVKKLVEYQIGGDAEAHGIPK